MEFVLPSNLREQIASYDPVLKKEIDEKRKAVNSTRKRSTHPLGNVQNLIPTSIISATYQQEAVNQINKEELANRCKVFYREARDNGVIISKVFAILYHYESTWIAAWLPNEGEDYIYGLTVAFKNTAKASEIYAKIQNSLPVSMDECTYEKFDKSEFRIYTGRVKKEAISKNDRVVGWNLRNVSRWSKKGKTIYENCINKFSLAVTSNIPTWKDGTTFERIHPVRGSICHVLDIVRPISYPMTDEATIAWKLTTDSLLEAIKVTLPNSIPFLKTPFFRKWVQEMVDKSNYLYSDPATERKKDINVPINKVSVIARWIHYVLLVWPDTPVDYFRNYFDSLQFIQSCSLFHEYTSGKAIPWLRENMPVASFFRIISRHHSQWLEKLKDMTPDSRQRYINRATDLPVVDCYELNDTINMINNLVHYHSDNPEVKLTPPRRWRIEEFHDHVQAISWKTNNKNEDLPQDLFPEPIKVEVNGSTWNFFQPKDLHQLAEWGRAVRNCVGNASSYADGVKKKKHFIVLCMIDREPRFTIQLRVNSGCMNVAQIVDISNSRLDQNKEYLYTQAFSKALMERENTLTLKEQEEVANEEMTV